MSVELITRFYSAFAAGDADGMEACYDPDVQFEDPVFGRLQAGHVMAMWRMLLRRNKTGLDIKLERVVSEGGTGSCVWIASYEFSRTGRKVVNVIEAEFVFRDGLIVSHRDRFSVWRWARQALGLPGWVLGWTPWMASKLRSEARKGLGLRAG